MDTQYESVLAFWFEELTPEQHFEKSDAVDDQCRLRFESIYNELAVGVPKSWREQANGCLAAIIVLDQLPRNMFRGSAKAFATDPLALDVSRHAIASKFDQEIALERRKFVYLPYEHSEDIEDQRISVSLFESLDDERTLDYAQRHLEVIERFGRFPHRNAILNRTSTADELAYLAQPGSGF
ncbi:MAG: DUF924 family protein [Pseudomonadota bacterium]